MKILITGFDSFGGATVNPAYEAIKLLPDTIAGAEIVKLEVPTVFSKCAAAVEKGIKKDCPDMIINVGQAGGRPCITVEQVAINLAEARIPDNEGEQPLGESIKADGETAYFATLPIKAMVRNMRSHGIPANISYSAGTYVCNYLMYSVLHMTAKEYPGIRAGFIHVPFAMEQVVNRPTEPSMSLDMIAKGLEFAIEAAVEHEVDVIFEAGEIN